MLISAAFIAHPQQSALAADREATTTIDLSGTHFHIDPVSGLGGYVEDVSDALADSWALARGATAVPEGQDVHVHIEHNLEDWFIDRGRSVLPPEWAAGLAFPNEARLLLAPGSPDWEKTLTHELTHVAIGLASDRQTIPTWMTEGLAVATAEQWNLERATLMIQVGVRGAFHDFGDLERGFPRDEVSAELAYAQSFHLVRHLRGRFGENLFLDIFSRMRDGEDWESAFRSVTGETPEASYYEWRQGADTRYKWAPLGTTGGAAWVFICLLSIVAWRRKSQVRKERLARMAKREAVTYHDDPDDQIFS